MTFRLFLISTMSFIFFSTGTSANETTPHSGPVAKEPVETSIFCKQMFNSEDASFQKNQRIFIVDGRITKISQADERHFNLSENSQPRVKIINWCLPGLIDTHVHLEQSIKDFKFPYSHPDESYFAMQAVEHSRKTLRAGFTLVRDLISGRNVAFVLKDLIQREESGKSGGLIGPSILFAGAAFGPKDGHGDFFNKISQDGRPNAILEYLTYYGKKFIFGEASVKDWFELYFATKPNWYGKHSHVGISAIPDSVKIMATGGVLSSNPNGHKPQLDKKTIFKAMEEVRKWETTLGRKIPVAAHTHGFDGIEAVAEAGVDSIEHASELFVNLNDKDPIKEQRRLKLVKLISEKNIYLSPTLTAAQTALDIADQLPEPIRSKAKAIGPKLLDGFGPMARAAQTHGIKIVFGSDTGVSKHGQNWHELVYMLAYGKGYLSANEVLRSATFVAAQSLGLEDEVGQIKKGAFANIIGFEKDPARHLDTLASQIDTSKRTSVKGKWPVSYVMKKGRVYFQ